MSGQENAAPDAMVRREPLVFRLGRMLTLYLEFFDLSSYGVSLILNGTVIRYSEWDGDTSCRDYHVFYRLMIIKSYEKVWLMSGLFVFLLKILSFRANPLLFSAFT